MYQCHAIVRAAVRVSLGSFNCLDPAIPLISVIHVRGTLSYANALMQIARIVYSYERGYSRGPRRLPCAAARVNPAGSLTPTIPRDLGSARANRNLICERIADAAFICPIRERFAKKDIARSLAYLLYARDPARAAQPTTIDYKRKDAPPTSRSRAADVRASIVVSSRNTRVRTLVNEALIEWLLRSWRAKINPSTQNCTRGLGSRETR